MASINTNTSAMTALQSLKAVQTNLAKTQERVSTGLKVNNSKDNAAYYSIATTMKADVASFKAIGDNLALAGSSVATARKATEQIGALVQQVLEKVALAQANETVDRALIQKDIDALAADISTVIEQSSYNGQNLLKGTADVTVVTGIARNAGGSGIATTNFTFKQQDMLAVQTAIAAIDVKGAGDATDLEAALQAAEAQLKVVTEANAAFGLAETRIENQKDFISKVADNLTTGLGAIVDADMNEEAARFQALQVQQQLASQALSIANQQPQQILALFR
jgi:Flagellin and related hook-associated proteins